MRARTSGVEKVTTAIARRAIISGPARLKIDAWPVNVPPGADGGQCGRVRQRARRHPPSQKERPGPLEPRPRIRRTACLLRAAAAAQEQKAEERQHEPRALRPRAGAAAAGELADLEADRRDRAGAAGAGA